MSECGICYETKPYIWLPCSHLVCKTCYPKLRGDTCPFCREPFRNLRTPREHNGPVERDIEDDIEPWLSLDDTWVVYSRYSKNGTERIYAFKKGTEGNSWRNDCLTTVLKRRKRKRRN